MLIVKLPRTSQPVQYKNASKRSVKNGARPHQTFDRACKGGCRAISGWVKIWRSVRLVVASSFKKPESSERGLGVALGWTETL